MLDIGCMIWFRREPVIYKNAVNSTAAGTLLAPADPLRFAVIISADGSATMGVDFFSGPAIGGYIRVGTSAINLLLGEEDFGDLIKLPIYATTISTAVVASIITLAYNPGKYATYQRMVHEYLSKYGTP